ncbi:MAG: pilus assembly protein TadG-related protein [Hyphomonadaceae bacterium]|nr:pilus assembly protein TadG-related protein [Hyphomonadaceae bacterium]
MAIVAPAVIAAAGFSVETGYWYYLNAKAQNAADIASYAGAVSLRNGASVQEAKTAALAEAGTLGFSSTTGATLEANVPPKSGAHINPNSIEVLIDYPVPRFFSSLFSNKAIDGNARSVAVFAIAADACVLATHTTAPEALHLSGSASVSISGCEFMSNSISDAAFYMEGSSALHVDCVNMVGNYGFNGGSYSLTLDECNNPRTHLSRAEDPYANVPVPSTHGCDNLGGGPPSDPTILSPGPDGIRKFCNGLQLNGNYIFEPGVYIIDGGDFRIKGNSIVSGDDVTFYLADGTELDFNGNSTVTFQAPDAGTYEGLVFFGDRADTSSVHQINGTNSSSITGAIYTAGADLVFTGDFSGLDGCMQLIAGTIEMTGNTTINSSCDSYGIVWATVPGVASLAE